MPMKQGNLDGLCGVYSIINAMRIIRRDTEKESQALFGAIIEHLSRKRNLRKIVSNGMTIGVLFNIINDLDEDIPKDEYPRSRPFLSRDVTMPQVWTQMKQFLEKPANGTGAIIFHLSGSCEHWTVIKKIDDENVYLEDSCGLKPIPRQNITIRDTHPNKKRCCQIIPGEVIFIHNPAAKQKV